MKMLNILILSMALIVTGCATTKTLQATGGSRADGIVELSYEYGIFENPQPQWNDALVTAQQRCQSWGYSNAQPFGGSKSLCQAFNGYGNCLRYFVTVPYQCTDPINTVH